jgi:predicted Zn-dependent protease
MCDDESELAGVVAHEMGHVEGRHIADRMQKASRVNLATMAAVLASAFLGGGSQAGAAASTFAVAAAQTKMLQYSREDEEDSDRRALRALLPAGYDGWGLVRFMETMRRASPTPEGVPTYLFTHPLPENRAAYLATSLPPPPAEGPTVAELGPLWRAQARVLVQDPRDWGVRRFENRAQAYPESPDAHLGLALLVRVQGRYDSALASLETAAALAPADAEIRHERAVTLLRQGLVDEALAMLESLRSEGVATVPALRDLGWAYLEADQGEPALAVYDELTRRDPNWDKLDYYRGLALGKAGRAGEAHAALGDYYKSAGNRDLAAHHYREALSSLPPGDLRARVEKSLGDSGKKKR